MPVPPEIRKQWIESRLVDELGRPIRVHDWMFKNLIRAIDGYKAWRRGERVCSSCAAAAGEIFDTRAECERKPHAQCDGLAGHKITMVLIHLKRQQGKSTGVGAYVASEMVLAKNSTTLFVASAEDATEEIFEAKIKSPLERNPKISKKVVILGTSIRNPRKGNKLKFIATGLRSTPGGTWRRIFIDEAALVPNRVIGKLAPSITAAHGRECPEGHYTTGADPRSPTRCPKCSSVLEEFFGVLVMLSSSDEPTGVFWEMLQAEQEDPTPGTHVYSSDETLNEHASDETVDNLSASLGRAPSMKGWKQREFGNVFTRDGDEFLPEEAIQDILNKARKNLDSCEHPCVGFLDCSRTTDLMSLVLGADLEQAEIPFRKITGVRIDVFDPKDRRQFPKGRIQYAPPAGKRDGGSIREHLVSLFGGWVDPIEDKRAGETPEPNRFPGLLEIWIDITRWEEARDLFDWALLQPWRSRARAYQGDSLIRSLMWQALEERALAGRGALEMPFEKHLQDELRKAAVKMNDRTGRMEVVDSSDGDRRQRAHRDVSMSAAGVCWAASKFANRLAPTSRTHDANKRARVLAREIRARNASDEPRSSGFFREKL